MAELFIQQTSIKKGDMTFQSTVIETRDQSCRSNVFNRRQQPEFNGHHHNHRANNDFNSNSFGEQLFNNFCDKGVNDYDNSDIAKLLNGDLDDIDNNCFENDYDNSDIAKLLNGGLDDIDNNCFRNNNCFENDYENDFESKLQTLEDMLNNRQQVQQENNPASILKILKNLLKKIEERELDAKMQELKDQTAAKKPENSTENKIKELEGIIARLRAEAVSTNNKCEKQPEPNVLKRDDGKQPKQISAPIVFQRNDGNQLVILKDIKRLVNKDSVIDISNMQNCHQTPVKSKETSCLSFDYPANAGNSNIEMQKSHIRFNISGSPNTKSIYDK